jgi:hypothetical protein
MSEQEVTKNVMLILKTSSKKQQHSVTNKPKNWNGKYLTEMLIILQQQIR